MEEVRFQNLPRHLAIIMDGNGRWALRRSLPRIEGHRKGADAVRSVVRASRRWGVQVLTLYAFSMENWQRPPDEIQSLMALLVDYLRSERQEMLDNGIRLRVIGKPEDLRHQIQALLRETMEMTACNTDMILNLGISYSGRSEIVRAVGRLLADADAGRVNPKDLSEEMFSSYLDTQGLPDPDLLIRTSGEQRISNFLLWQMAYTEIYFTDTLWPDFSEDELLKALRDFEGRDRRFGRIAGPTPEP